MTALPLGVPPYSDHLQDSKHLIDSNRITTIPVTNEHLLEDAFLFLTSTYLRLSHGVPYAHNS